MVNLYELIFEREGEIIYNKKKKESFHMSLSNKFYNEEKDLYEMSINGFDSVSLVYCLKENEKIDFLFERISKKIEEICKEVDITGLGFNLSKSRIVPEEIYKLERRGNSGNID